jgi:hypothetical protein
MRRSASAFSWAFAIMASVGTFAFGAFALLGINPIGSVNDSSMVAYQPDAASTILLGSLSYAASVAMWVVTDGRARGVRRWAGIIVAVAIGVVVSCVLGGAAWTVRDMVEGWFPPFPERLTHVAWGAGEALRSAPQFLTSSLRLLALHVALGSYLAHLIARSVWRDDETRG